MKLEHILVDLENLKGKSRFEQQAILQNVLPELLKYKEGIDKEIVCYLTRLARPNLPEGDYRKDF